MKIKVNEEVVFLPKIMNIEQLITFLEKPLIGSAVAVNMDIINRTQWADFIINEGDNISLFQAIAGG